MSRLYVVGIGPGAPGAMTGDAMAALEQSEAIYGYTAYIELITPYFSHKQLFSTAMRSEIDRCRMAIDSARLRDTAMVCSGDPGVYGMAGLIMELLDGDNSVELEVIPGITAAMSGAALLGAPLMQDFAVLSLSDLLVDWSVIERRLRAVAQGGLVAVLYNPGSQRRTRHLPAACDIFLESRTADTVCGIVRNIAREGQSSKLLTLSELKNTPVDMFTTVFIGNDQTRVINGRMVTLRGYQNKL